MKKKFGYCYIFSPSIQMYLCLIKCVYHFIAMMNYIKLLPCKANGYFFVLHFGSSWHRIIMAFQERDGFDVVFFIMYTSETMYKDGRDDETYIALLDSVKYFEPNGLRTQVYYNIIISYLKYARDIG